MKAKYYPHVTVCGAAILFVAPLCLVLSLSYLRASSTADETAFADSVIDAVLAEESSGIVADIEPRSPAALEDPTPATPSKTEESTRVAMLPTEGSAKVAEYDPPNPVQSIDDAAAVRDMAALDTSTLPSETGVPVPQLMDSQLLDTEPNHQVSTTIKNDDAVKADEPAPMEVAFVEPNTDASTHFDATSHLAMRGSGMNAGESSSPMAAAAASSGHRASNTAGDRVADRRTGSLMSDADKRRLADDAMAASDLMGRGKPKEGSFGELPEAILEEVILQQPLESRMVSRMENVVAVTRAQGWPIALVKSDLPDDKWWVQQMVGIRGNAFAARVNFGNEHSIRGSVYHLVFVFLDSPDEVRRFRIAKQFKDLPEGTRRSREYTFTRK